MISIVIPTYNRAKVIPAALNSIVVQSYQDWECIVVDDYSEDDTESVVNSYVAKDNRFSYCKNERTKGAPGARNTGLYQAKGEWVLFFDSDNTMAGDMLAKFAGAISVYGKDVYTCYSKLIDSTLNIETGQFNWYAEGQIHDKLFDGSTYVDNSSSIIRKQALMDIGGVDENCPSMQEWDTHIRLSETCIYHTIPEYLVNYYVGSADRISANGRREVDGRLFILKKFSGEWLERKQVAVNFILYIIYLSKQTKSLSFRLSTIRRVVCYVPGLTPKICYEAFRQKLSRIISRTQ